VGRATIEGEVEGLDEEFLFHLSRGGDLLAKGENESARVSLERAFGLRPRDAKVLGLLGQAYYRIGLFERSIEIYGKMVEDNPAEAAARVNLGLANLKAKRHLEAVRQLTIALDLHPSHKKAMGYLGLALLDSGEPAKAREWFVKAGSEVGVARCDELLAGAPARAAPLPGPEDHAEPARAPLPDATAGAPPSSSAYPALAAFAAARLVLPRSDEPFSVHGKTLVIGIRGELLTRIDGLYAARGSLEIVPAMKQFRGRATDTPFGEGGRRMHRVSGAGSLLFAVGGRCFTPLDLGAEAGYFREEVVFAFEEMVAFENGRVPAKSAPDLNLVHLRGRGRLLLATQGEPAALEVSAREPLRVPIEALVGWVGALTPRVMLLPEAPVGAEATERTGAALVELSGDGRALVDPAATLEREPRA
jgi:uncharacterized protein (AIM24 family)